jgi:hypothetical protein
MELRKNGKSRIIQASRILQFWNIIHENIPSSAILDHVIGTGKKNIEIAVGLCSNW